MPEQNEPDTGKAKTYQSIAVYDGSNPAYFANWHTKVLSHYATWLNGEERAGHWKQHHTTPHMQPLTRARRE